jgi:hypothetical protein
MLCAFARAPDAQRGRRADDDEKEMTMRRLAHYSLCMLGMLVLIGIGSGIVLAADAPAATPHPTKKAPRHVHAHAKATDSEAARREREHRDDLERRVEHLEQENEMKQPNMPPPDPAR